MTTYSELLSSEAAGALAAQIQAANVETFIAARNALVEANLRLVRASLSHFSGHYLYDDLLSEGRLALVEAAETWDPERGAFSTYAREAIRVKAYKIVKAEDRQDAIHGVL